VTVNPLRGRVNHYVSAPFKRITQISACSEGVIYYERDTFGCGRAAYRFKVWNSSGRVAHTFSKNTAGALVDKPTDSFSRGFGGDTDFDSELAESMAE